MCVAAGFERRGRLAVAHQRTRLWGFTMVLHFAALMLLAAARLVGCITRGQAPLWALLYSVITTLHDHDLEPDKPPLSRHLAHVFVYGHLP
jgi:hypothetical protein